MSFKTLTVEQMKEYLGFAKEFEKEVYYWSGLSHEILSRYNTLDKERTNLSDRVTLLERGMQSGNSPQKINHKNSQKNKLLYGLLTAFSIILIPIVFILMISNEFFSSLFNPAFIMLILAVSAIVCAINFIKSCIKSSDNKVFISDEKRLLNYREKLSVIETECTHLSNQYNTAKSSLQKAQSNLASLYGLNVINKKFQNFSAVTTMHGYLENHRCSTIEGHGGIFDTYLTEKIQIEQLVELMKIRGELAEIKNNQLIAIKELRNINANLTVMKGTLSNIERSNEQIQKNTSELVYHAREWDSWRYRHF